MTETNLTTLAACALLFLTAAGCAPTPPSDFYVLTPMAAAGDSAAAPSRESVSVSVGPVKIPEYLNRVQIVTRAGQNRLDVNEFNRWGGSLASNLSTVIAENLSVLLGTDEVYVFPTQDPVSPRYRVVLSVAKFDGALGESAVLDVRWLITGPRRREQLLALRPDLQVTDLRGNVPTRVRRVREGRYDAVVLAAAGVMRLELDTSDLVVVPLSSDLFVPSPAQGALAVQVRHDTGALRLLCTHLLHDEATAATDKARDEAPASKSRMRPWGRT